MRGTWQQGVYLSSRRFTSRRTCEIVLGRAASEGDAARKATSGRARSDCEYTGQGGEAALHGARFSSQQKMRGRRRKHD